MSSHLPVLFVSHGAPLVLLEENPVRQFLFRFGESIPRPSAVLCISAHWDTPSPTVTASPAPPTIHDFFGFPPVYYEQRYSAAGDVELAKKIIDLLQESGFEAVSDEERGLDHGAWIPLALMYPDADIPVVQLSIQTRETPAHHYRIGQALRVLREDGVLIMGSGQATHNLRHMNIADINTEPRKYAIDFDEWLREVVALPDKSALLNYRQEAPGAVESHPTDEHLVPIFVASGAADGRPGNQVHSGFNYGAISMSAYAWDYGAA